MKISIIIPYYKNRIQLERFLNSCEVCSDQEIIVVKDCDDDIVDLKWKYNFLNIIIYRSNGRWAGAARNLGIEKSTGDYLLFCDSDDELASGYISIIDEVINSFNGYDLIYFTPLNGGGGNEDRSIKFKKLIDNAQKKNSDELLKFHPPWSKLYKKKFLTDNNILFDEVIASNDVMFSIKCNLKANKILISNSAIYIIHNNDNSLTKNTSDIVISERIKILIKENRYLKDSNKHDYTYPVLIYIFLLKISIIRKVVYIIINLSFGAIFESFIYVKRKMCGK